MNRKVNWVDDALCIDSPYDFFAEPYEPDIRLAQNTCVTCPVRKDCLEWALNMGEYYGVWGGVTADVLQEAQNLDTNGKYKRGKVRKECPYCGHQDVHIVPTSEHKIGQATCQECHITWPVHIMPFRRRS